MFILKKKSLFYSICACFCLFAMGLFALTPAPQSLTRVYAAETNTNVSYFTAKNSVTQKDYKNGDTVFLDAGQNLVITFGKPVGNPIDANGSQNNIYTAQEEIGDAALSYLSGSFDLSINGKSINNIIDYYNNGKFDIVEYIYSPNYDIDPTSGDSYFYFYMEINLSDTAYFPTGEYDISFYSYMEHSQEDFSVAQTKTFTSKFYIFNTTDYFSNDFATSQNCVMDNTRQTTPKNATYKNYYFFNYTNFGSPIDTYNSMPVLSYDADKFDVTITKTYQGISQSLTVSNSSDGFITLGQATNEEFVKVNKTDNRLNIIFSDIGEYKLAYSYLYKNSAGQVIKLESEEITAATVKEDILHVFGYQLFYFDKDEEKINEFKSVTDGKTSGISSADISYMIPYEDLTNTSINELDNDQSVIDLVKNTPCASTNQPVVSSQYNVNLQNGATTAYSYYYKWDGVTSDFEKDASNAYIKYTYTNNSFADSGIYLLKIVYTFDNNLNDSGNSAANTFFTQYFYFEITNSTAVVTLNELIDNDNDGIIDSENILSTDAFTQNSVKVSVSGQSEFNSDIKVEIASKNFGSSIYLPEKSILGTTQLQNAIFTENKNYKVTLTYGKTKSQVSYFTIDNTAFTNVNVINVAKSDTTANYYIKDRASVVNFFTNNSVTIEWDEKLSGAASNAYYKFIPFEKVPAAAENYAQFVNYKAIPTNYALDFEVTDVLSTAKFHNSKNYELLTGKYVFTQQGLYIVKLSDEAGNWQYITFCIDKTELVIWQYCNGSYQTVYNYNVVSSDARLEWGKYKLISTSIPSNNVASIEDTWVKDIITEKFVQNSDKDFFINEYDNSKLCFSPEISSTCYIQTNNTTQKFVNGLTYYNITLETTIDDYTFVKEATYTIYLMDESNNKYFTDAEIIEQDTFVNNCSKNYSITTTSDASQSDILINTSNTTSEDLSGITFNSTSLTQSGFTDSSTYNTVTNQYNTNIDLRTKYYATTGITKLGDVSLLSYKVNLNPSDVIKISKIEMYYYPFVIENNIYKLSEFANEKIIIYDNENNLTSPLYGDFTGFVAYNINPEYNTSKNIYQTKEGKYVIVRTYTDNSSVKENDFLVREFSFIVDRQNIVSAPIASGSDYLSIIGQNIFVNVLDGDKDNCVKFKDMFMAYSTDSAILSTNKLPAVLYVPVAKYGSGDDLSFSHDPNLKYYYETILRNNQYLIERFDLNNQKTYAKIQYSYFGDNQLVSSNFDYPNYLDFIANSGLNLSVTIEYSQTKNGTRTPLTMTLNGNSTLGYYVSANLSDEGFYFVTITQNTKNGITYPNSYSTFSFNFEVISQKPNFDFVNTSGDVLNSDENDISYTNENQVQVKWKDPSDPYLAKIDMSNDGTGKAKGIYYYTSKSSLKTYVSLSDITTEGNYHWFNINLANMSNDTIVYVYMEYEGIVKNTSSSIVRALYIDRIAPTKVIEKLLNANMIDGTSVASYTRQYVDEFDIATNVMKKYNVPNANGALAKFVFTLPKLDNVVLDYLTAQDAVSYSNGAYYTEGYNYYARQINLDSWTVTKVNSAKNAFATHTVAIATTAFQNNGYYEIVETDLAGNITIYGVYFINVDHIENKDVFTYSNPAPNASTVEETTLTYGQLQANQDIFVKSYFKGLELNLHDYKWLTISVDNKIYIKAPVLADNEYYSISDWNDTTTTPKIVTLESILDFKTSNNVHKLKILDSAVNKTYQFNIYVTDLGLSVNPISDAEGVVIRGISYSNGVYVSLESIEIFSRINNQYESIYNYTKDFVDNYYVQSTFTETSWQFTIIEPVLAYKYVFYDNYGVSYVFYHTVGEPTIEDVIVGNCDQVLIEEDNVTHSWSVGNDNMEFYFSNVDYNLYMNTEILTIENGQYSWVKYQHGGISNIYGDLISENTQSSYYNCSTSAISPSICKVNLLALSQTPGLTTFSGGVIRFTLTLVNVNENDLVALDKENVIQYRIFINNLIPNIYLADKNNTDKTYITNGDALFSGQLTIRFDALNINSPFMYPVINELTTDNTITEEISSGKVLTQAGSYIVKTYIVINGNKYLCNTESFIISASSDEFFSVVAYNDDTQVYDKVVESTGEVFQYNNKYFTTHYIVNTNYQIRINEEQDITAIESAESYNMGGTITKFYEITNRNSTSSSINYYSKNIAVTYVNSDNLISTNMFYYTSVDGSQIKLAGTNTKVVVTNENQDFSVLKIAYNSYYGIPENTITPIVFYGENLDIEYLPKITKINASTSELELANSGYYSISFVDKAGNTHKFTDTLYNYSDKYYNITFINGVAFNINGATPIENAIYNDKAVITLPQTLNTGYDDGGRPQIVATKNGKPFTVRANSNGEYVLDEAGYYTVYFDATIGGINVRKQTYSFTVLKQNEYRWAFEYSPFANYEIVEIKKNNTVMDYSNYFDNKSVFISLYDNVTGAGNYEITIKTNSTIANEMFTFNFAIKSLESVPFDVSIDEGATTASPITVSFNAYQLYENLGTTTLVLGDRKYVINEEYLNTLNSNYYVTFELTKNGTHFIQLESDSGKVLYSYKVIKAEPLNSLSIILIVVGVLGVAGIVVVFTLLRKRMKIK